MQLRSMPRTDIFAAFYKGKLVSHLHQFSAWYSLVLYLKSAVYKRLKLWSLINFSGCYSNKDQFLTKFILEKSSQMMPFALYYLFCKCTVYLANSLLIFSVSFSFSLYCRPVVVRGTSIVYCAEYVTCWYKACIITCSPEK